MKYVYLIKKSIIDVAPMCDTNCHELPLCVAVVAPNWGMLKTVSQLKAGLDINNFVYWSYRACTH